MGDSSIFTVRNFSDKFLKPSCFVNCERIQNFLSRKKQHQPNTVLDRVPVFERRVDNIVGIAYAMDMLDYVEQVRFYPLFTKFEAQGLGKKCLHFYS